MLGRLSRLLLGIGCLCWAGLIAASPVCGARVWSLGQADARLIQAGWRYDSKAGNWIPEVELRLVNRDAHRPFHRPVRVEFIGTSGRVWVWRTFVELAPGTAQHRRVSAPGLRGCAGPLSKCPLLGLRVDLKPHDPTAAIVPIPAVALVDSDAPPAGQPLYVASVEDGAVLKLMDGRRVRPLGLRFASRAQSAAASAWVRSRVMDAPVVLSYDAVPPDHAGHWLAYVLLADGGDLGIELLRHSLALPDPTVHFTREAAYRAASTGVVSRAHRASGRWSM